MTINSIKYINKKGDQIIAFYKDLQIGDYDFRFKIVKKYQDCLFDDWSYVCGYGFVIYVLEAPNLRELRYDQDFHFNNQNGPTICWNHLIEDFSDANAVMIVWAKRYVRLLNRRTSRKSRINLPTGTFRTHKGKNNMQNINKTTMLMTSKVFQEIQETIGTYKAETGGMLGSSNGQIIDHFIFDKNAVTGYAEYNPNTQYLSDILNEEWTEQDIQLMGFIHSHPRGCTSPSYADEEYADRIMKALDMDTFFMPIVMTSYAGQKFSINTYVNLLGEKYNHLETCQLEIVDINEEEIYETEQIDIEEITELSEDQIAEIEEKFNQMTKPKTTNAAETQPVNKELDNQNHSPKEPTLFDRISSTVDLKVLEESLIVGIGCGGAREFYLDMARTGVGNFIFMDGDKVEVSNVGVQGSYQDEIGQYKTDCIREKILNINPKAHVISMPQFLKDDFSDEEFQEMIKDFEPENILLCGFTDDFAAQARTAKLAETLGINYLAAQHYALGIASEIVYWVPNISQATPEQLLASRYEEYENGYKNDVTSQGSPIFNTTRLNALCEKLALGILLFDNYPEGIYSAFLTMIPHKNFILIRHNPFAHLELGMETFFQNPYTFMDDVVWLSNDDLNPNEENEDDENVPFE